MKNFSVEVRNTDSKIYLKFKFQELKKLESFIIDNIKNSKESYEINIKDYKKKYLEVLFKEINSLFYKLISLPYIGSIKFRLDFIDNKEIPKIYTSLKEIKQLKKLKLYNAFTNNNIFMVNCIPPLSSLKLLELTCMNYSNEIDKLFTNTKLKILKFDEVKFTHDSVITLDLSKCEYISFTEIEKIPFKNLYNQIKGNTNLQVFRLNRVFIEQEDLPYLFNIIQESNVEDLLDFYVTFDDLNFTDLNYSFNLKSFNVFGNEIEPMFYILENCSILEEFSMESFDIIDNTMLKLCQILQRIKTLKKLFLFETSVCELEPLCDLIKSSPEINTLFLGCYEYCDKDCIISNALQKIQNIKSLGITLLYYPNFIFPIHIEELIIQELPFDTNQSEMKSYFNQLKNLTSLRKLTITSFQILSFIIKEYLELQT